MAKDTETRPAAPRDPREEFLAANVSAHTARLTPSALDDLRYFEQRAKEGRPLTVLALERWLREKHSLKIGRDRLGTLCEEYKIKPWWSTRR